MVIVHSYVSLPEGIYYITLSQFESSHLIGMFGYELIYVNGEVDVIMITRVFWTHHIFGQTQTKPCLRVLIDWILSKKQNI